MNPLAALSIDRTALMGENLRPHGAVFYPALHPLSAEKPQEPSPSLALGYELLYKPDVSLLDGQKSANGYVGLYKNPPPVLQKPLLVPVAGGEGLGLDRRVLHGDKQAELGLNGAGSFLRLPWIGSYADASMYPFLDMAYKASFLSQPPHFLHQQLAYQSLVAAGSGGSAPGEDRLFYLPAYAQAHISSQLGAPIRMATAAPASVISPLPHSQDKTLQGLSPKVHQEPSAFSTSPQIHQDPLTPAGHHAERQHGGSGSKSGQTASTKSRGSGGGASGTAVLDSPSVPRPSGSIPSIQPLSNSTADLQSSLYKNSTSSLLSVPHALYGSSGRSSPKYSSSNKTKDGNFDRSRAEKSASPGKTLLDRAVPQKMSKNPGEKPLDLSAKELEAFPNGFPAKLEALAKLGYLPPSRYGVFAGQDQNLKEGLPVSEKTPEQPEGVGTSSSTWAVPGPSSQSLKSKNVDHTPHRPQPPGTPGAPTGNSVSSPTSSGRPSVVAPSPKSKVVWPRGSASDSDPQTGKAATPAKSDHQEVQAYLHQEPRADSRGSSSQIYGESYLPPGLGYTNRYIPYSVAENMSLQRLPMQGKAPMYPHPILLGGSSFYAAHMAPKHGLPYGGHAYQGSQEMVPTLIPTYSKDELDGRSKNQEKVFPSFRTQERPEAETSQESGGGRDRFSHQTAKASGKSHTYVRDDVVCIDLVHDETDEAPPAKPDSVRQASETRRHIPDKESWPLKAPNPDQGAEPRPGLPLGPPSSPPPEVEPLSQTPDIPEELTMRCARTCPQQFSRKNKSGGARDVTLRGEHGPPESEAARPHQTLFEDGHSSVPVTRDARSSGSDVGGSVCSLADQRSPAVSCIKGPNSSDLGPQVPAAKTFNPRTSPSLNGETGGPAEPNASACEPRIFTNGDQCNLRANALYLSNGGSGSVLCMSQTPPAGSGATVPTSGGSFSEHLPPTIRASSWTPGDRTPESPLADNPFADNPFATREGGTRDPGVQDGLDSHEDEDDGAPCGQSRRSSLAKRIANSSGYVGDRIKCVTTELNADSSQLSREQRALQRAMLRFSELELKEREGGRGGEEEEEEAEEEEELAGDQRGDGERRGEEGEEVGWERSQGGGGGGGGGGGRTPTAAAAEAPSGPLPASAPGRIFYFKEKNDGPAREGSQEEEKEPPEEEQQRQQQQQQQPRSSAVPGGLFQAPSPGLAAASGPAAAATAALSRRRLFSLEPFHQSSIVSGRLKRGREEEKEEEEEEEEGRAANPNRKLANDSALDEVKKLKVCIELNGLRLNRPRLPGELGQWYPSDRRIREDVRSEVNGGLSDAAFLRADGGGGVRVFHMAPPSSSLPRQPCGPAPRPPPPLASLASPRLQDKHQRLRESRRLSAFLPLLPPPPPPSYPASSPAFTLRRPDDVDPDKPKGKRPCKLKHTAGGEGGGAEGDDTDGESDREEEEESAEKVSPPRSPGGRPPSPRPVPPEVRRLIVNKNAGETLLQRAARLGYEEVVLYCLERRLCDVNHRDNAGYCALHEACARGWLGIVRHLVEHGADVNCSALDGTRPLHDAVENDHLEVVRLLLACGADPTLTSYSGRGPINMTHSAAMETFLDEYLSDLQGRSEGDPGIYWEFYGSSVCEPSSEGGHYNVLADPPGPEDEEEDENQDQDVEQRARREVFEFELSDRPLLPCYNIQVSLSQGRRNWLLLADVLARLRMTSRSFRRLFPQLNVQSLPEDEFYRQASLSQLLTGPDRSELASFRPDARDPLELVEATPELAGMLGSSLECVDTRHEAPPPPPPPSPPPQQQIQPGSSPAPAADKVTAQYEVTVENKNSSTWEPQGAESNATAAATAAAAAAKPHVVLNAAVWELQRHREKLPRAAETACLVLVKPEEVAAANMWELQRLRSRSAGTSGAEKPRSKTAPSAAATATATATDTNVWKDTADKTGSGGEPASGDGVESESQQPRSKDAPARPDAPAQLDAAARPDAPARPDATARPDAAARPDAPVCPGVKRPSDDSGGGGGDAAVPKIDTVKCESHGGKSLKLDAAWQRNLGNVRVHIRDLGIRVSAIQRAVKAEAGKVVVKGGRVKMRS